MLDGYEDALTLLRRLGAPGIAHPGGYLLDHLQRVEARLEGHGADDTLRLAGLTHAVYGTDGFDVQLLGTDDRDTLIQVVGTDAEALVYLYAACDRKQTWPTLSQTHQVHDRWIGGGVSLRQNELARFVDLTIVNELDVVDHAVDMKMSHGPELLRLVRSWQVLGSRSVTADALSTLSP